MLFVIAMMKLNFLPRKHIGDYETGLETLIQACSLIVIILENGHGDRIQILDEVDCISHCTNTLGNNIIQLVSLHYY